MPPQAFLDALSSAVVLLDTAGVVRAANRRARELFGCAGGGSELARTPLARQNSELMRRIHLGRPCELLLSLNGGAVRTRVRLVPLGSGLLLEGDDVTDAVGMRRELQAVHASDADLQDANEELRCAYEVIETGNELSREQTESEASLSEELFQSNRELVAIIQGLQRRVEALERGQK